MILKTNPMAKYSKGAQKKVEKSMHEMKRGKLKSGRSGKTVKSRKQAIAIGLSEARERGAKVPPPKKGAKKSAAKRGARKSSAKKGAKKGRSAKKSVGTRKRAGRPAKRGGAKKSSSRRGGAKKSSSRRGGAKKSSANRARKRSS